MQKKLDIPSDEFMELPKSELQKLIEEEKLLIIEELNSQNIYSKG